MYMYICVYIYIYTQMNKEFAERMRGAVEEAVRGWFFEAWAKKHKLQAIQI